MTACKPRVLGFELVGAHFSGGREGFSKERRVEDLNPKESMVQRGSPWVVKGAAAASGHMHPGGTQIASIGVLVVLQLQVAGESQCP